MRWCVMMSVYAVGPGAYNDNHATSMATELAKRSMWVASVHSYVG